jgi:hypothetical protein
MKKALRYGLILFVVLISDKCNLFVSPKNYYSVSGTVYCSINGRSPEIQKGIEIFIEEEKTITDQNGRFMFEKISEGEHFISINSPTYQSYSQFISVAENMNVDVLLNRIKDDYFPIHVNSTKKYKYFYHTYSGIGDLEINGEAMWNVNSSRMDGDTIVYSVMETLFSTITSTGATSSHTQLDTLFSTFEIRENSSHQIKITSIPILPAHYRSASYILNGASFNRYLDFSEDGIILLDSFWPDSVLLKSNEGFYLIDQFRYHDHTRYELIE